MVRHRHLALILDRLAPVVSTANVALEFGPTKIGRRLLERYVDDRYLATDIGRHRDVDFRSDACRMGLRDGAVDVIVSFHVLEHIPDDRTAIAEMARILSPGGVALIQVPWRRDRPTDEDPTAPPEERRRRFGFPEHLRFYGTDLEDRLREGGLVVRRWDAGAYLPADVVERAGLPPESPLWVCRPARRHVPAVTTSGSSGPGVRWDRRASRWVRHRVALVAERAKAALTARVRVALGRLRSYTRTSPTGGLREH
ncbi:MAG: class I SAM-dependent methyltransferase [Acidimicrobiales bacterium]